MPFVPKDLLILDSVDSTNNYAMAMIQDGKAVDGTAVFACEQTGGKGRRGRQWISNKSDNIILSILTQMQWYAISQQFGLSVAVALGCFDAVSQYVPGKVSIKWPNDIFINDTKAGGILIENAIRGTLWQWAVIGIGLNINQEKFTGSAFKATSLKVVTGDYFNVLQLSKELYESVLKRIDRLKEGAFDKMLEEYNQNLFAHDQLVKIKKGNTVFETTIKGVSAKGQLITVDKIRRHFNFDEIQFLGLVELPKE